MIVALYILIALVGVGCILRLTHKPDEPTSQPLVTDEGQVCCGRHAVCDKIAEAALAEKPVYFDDEELDIYARRNAADYSAEEVEQFRDVLFTLLPSDLAPWAHSLEMRQIALPETLRDEFILLLADSNS